MSVKINWTRTIIIIAVSCSTSVNALNDFFATTESSEDYLRKVMIELKDLNGPSLSVPDRANDPFYFDVDDKHFLARKRLSDDRKNKKSTIFSTVENKLPIVADDQGFAESANHNQYYQVPAIVRAPQKAIPTEAPTTFTKGELAAFYNHAMEQGSVASLNALANVLRDKQLPTFTANKVAITPAQSMYTYHFYPIKSFMNDMRQNLQPNLLPISPGLIQHQPQPRPEETKLMQENQKEVANPLFAAISGFIGMAVLFMIGMFLLPRFGDFSSRVSNNDDYLRLTDTICGAIDRHNCTYYPDIKNLDKRANFRKPGRITRPSSVVLLPSNSIRHKNSSKRRRKINGNCKNLSCKKNHRTAET